MTEKKEPTPEIENLAIEILQKHSPNKSVSYNGSWLIGAMMEFKQFSLYENTSRTIARPHTIAEFPDNKPTPEKKEEETQEELWNDIDHNYIIWNGQQIKLSDLIRDFELKRRI